MKMYRWILTMVGVLAVAVPTMAAEKVVPNIGETWQVPVDATSYKLYVRTDEALKLEDVTMVADSRTQQVPVWSKGIIKPRVVTINETPVKAALLGTVKTFSDGKVYIVCSGSYVDKDGKVVLNRFSKPKKWSVAYLKGTGGPYLYMQYKNSTPKDNVLGTSKKEGPLSICLVWPGKEDELFTVKLSGMDGVVKFDPGGNEYGIKPCSPVKLKVIALKTGKANLKAELWKGGKPATDEDGGAIAAEETITVQDRKVQSPLQKLRMLSKTDPMPPYDKDKPHKLAALAEVEAALEEDDKELIRFLLSKLDVDAEHQRRWLVSTGDHLLTKPTPGCTNVRVKLFLGALAQTSSWADYRRRQAKAETPALVEVLLMRFDTIVRLREGEPVAALVDEWLGEVQGPPDTVGLTALGLLRVGPAALYIRWPAIPADQLVSLKFWTRPEFGLDTLQRWSTPKGVTGIVKARTGSFFGQGPEHWQKYSLLAGQMRGVQSKLLDLWLLSPSAGREMLKPWLQASPAIPLEPNLAEAYRLSEQVTQAVELGDGMLSRDELNGLRKATSPGLMRPPNYHKALLAYRRKVAAMAKADDPGKFLTAAVDMRRKASLRAAVMPILGKLVIPSVETHFRVLMRCLIKARPEAFLRWAGKQNLHRVPENLRLYMAEGVAGVLMRRASDMTVAQFRTDKLLQHYHQLVDDMDMPLDMSLRLTAILADGKRFRYVARYYGLDPSRLHRKVWVGTAGKILSKYQNRLPDYVFLNPSSVRDTLYDVRAVLDLMPDNWSHMSEVKAQLKKQIRENYQRKMRERALAEKMLLE